MATFTIFDHDFTISFNPRKFTKEDSQKLQEFYQNVEINTVLSLLETIDYNLDRINELSDFNKDLVLTMYKENFIIKSTIEIFESTGIRGWKLYDQNQNTDLTPDQIPETLPPQNIPPEIIDQNLDQARSQLLGVLKQK